MGREETPYYDTLSELSESRSPEQALSTHAFRECLAFFCAQDTGRTLADTLTRHYYQQEQRTLIWVERLGRDARMDTLIAQLRRRVDAVGFSSHAFGLPQLAADLDSMRRLEWTDVESHSADTLVARLEWGLTRALLRYCIGQHWGFTRPAALLNRLDERVIAEEKVGYNTLFALKMQPLPNMEWVTEVLEQTDVDRLSDFLDQMEPADTLYQLFQRQLGATRDATHRMRLMVNMERRRWQVVDRPKEQERYIFVNIPAQQLWAVSPDSVLNMRVVCGALRTKTPLLCSRIRNLELNPEWVIPISILRNEVCHHAGDSAYFARNHYYITPRDSRTDTLSPRDITQAQLSSGLYRVAQMGGPGNSMGRIVFRFPNDFSVYLHDTSNRRAFKSEHRLLSHGCVRVQLPFELARFVLGDGATEWTLDQIRIAMDMHPEGERGKKYVEEHEDMPRPLTPVRWIEVAPRVPVYITYYTLYPNPESGQLQTWPDVYGYDRQLERAIKPFL